MKKLSTVLLFIFISTSGFAQKQLISYDDLRFILHNSLTQADTFLITKGYSAVTKNDNTKNRKYSITFKDNSYININARSDGRQLFLEIETNYIGQYNLIQESIRQYINRDSMLDDIQTYSVKNLGNIYITVKDTQPYNPLTKDYDIQVVADRRINTYSW
ncbi:MAG: hypothetical protein EOP45_09960 [Sphingobacteriaceae bacterium]|nr:MAG: hypothetical protein EOP45_09960 [Sphingobacteriaceae bacterium]